MPKQTVLLRMSVLVEVDEEDLEDDWKELHSIETKLSDSIDAILETKEDSELGWCSTRFIILDEKELNCGRCSSCKSWVTDFKKSEAIEGLPDSTVFEGKLLCEVCLYGDHGLDIDDIRKNDNGA